MVYLDNAATTSPRFHAWDWGSYWMNSNMPYARGAQYMLDTAREDIKKCLKVNSGKVLFCRCATEAVEWLCNRLGRRPGTVICCSPYEHDSVAEAIKAARFNDATTRIPKDCDTYLQQYVNQMTGEIFDIARIGEEVWATTDGYAFYGVDMTAAIGHTPIPDGLDTFCDAIWFSGHKFHVEKGIGAIWLSDRLFEYLGGSKDSKNEYGLIHGTVNVPAAIALSQGLESAINAYNIFAEQMYADLSDHLARELSNWRMNGGVDAKMVCGDDKKKSQAIWSITFPGINADALQTYLASKQIYISTGHSACANDADYRVLKAYGLSQEDCECTVRISFSVYTTKEDIDQFIQGVKEYKETYL